MHALRGRAYDIYGYANPAEGYKAGYIVCLVKTKEDPLIIGKLENNAQKMSQEMLGEKVGTKGVYAHADEYSGGEFMCPVFEISQ